LSSSIQPAPEHGHGVTELGPVQVISFASFYCGRPQWLAIYSNFGCHVNGAILSTQHAPFTDPLWGTCPCFVEAQLATARPFASRVPALSDLRFVDLFAGLGGFHLALRRLGHECVFAAEIDPELRELYKKNFRDTAHGDIRACKSKVPAHDILCAGFPCQPFSKSGDQRGLKDETRGTLFHEIAQILEKHRPPYVILENVGNFERHDRGRTWAIVKKRLTELGYNVRGTEHIASGGHGLVSPHHLGFPHTRERFFVLASLKPLPQTPFPRRRKSTTSLHAIVQMKSELSRVDLDETTLTQQQVDCINHWTNLLKKLPEDIDLPSFPIWGDEILASYPFRGKRPHICTATELRKHLRHLRPPTRAKKSDLIALFPSYAREKDKFPPWKIQFIEQSREWFDEISPWLSSRWVRKLWTFPPSLRKLEWNCQGEHRDLWKHVLQFRPSGLRVKRYTSSPALVAMTTTQIPILGPKRRFITRVEGLRLQGFPDHHHLPKAREKAFAALGNAVHVGVVRAIARRLLANE
jgi:DNA (cytosine-5)-methyltransferase 1